MNQGDDDTLWLDVDLTCSYRNNINKIIYYAFCMF